MVLSDWLYPLRFRRTPRPRRLRSPVRESAGVRPQQGIERLESRLYLSAVASYSSATSDWFGSLAATESDANSVAAESLLVVRLTESATAQAGDVAGVQRLFESQSIPGTVVRGLGLPGMVLVRGASEQNLAVSSLVSSVTEDQSVFAQQLPDDSEFAAQQYSFNNTGQFFGTANADINAPQAWDKSTGSHSVVVPVIDSGIDYTHPDLFRNVWINQGEIPPSLAAGLIDTDSDGLITFIDLNQPANSASVTDDNGNGFIDAGDLLVDSRWENGIDEDGNGLTDDLIGWDFLNNDNDPIDDHRHGTHVAGTIGAVGNNGFGVAGINWDVSLMPLKFLNTQLVGSTSDAILAINYATMMRSQFDTNVRVMNASWGSLDNFNPALQTAIRSAQTADILFVAAAGNGDVTGRGVDLDNDLGFFPASFDVDNIIAVAATDNNDNLARFSNFGATSVDLAAPGIGIAGLNLGGDLIFRTGTSMATPHVTGTVALLAALRPFATASEIRDAVLGSVRTVGGLSGDVATGGVLNAEAALNIDTFAPLVQFAVDNDGNVIPPADITTDGGTTQDIFVRYEDDTLLDISMLDAGDLIVRKQDDGTEFSVSFLFGPNSNIAIATAGYRMTAPGGTWLLEDNGIYEVILQAGEVSDTGGRFSREVTIGSFEVAIEFAGQIDVTTTMDGTTTGTLRAAVIAANAEAGLNTIALRTGETYTLDISGAGEDASTTGDLDITDAAGLVIRGNGATIAVVGEIDRVFDVRSSGALTLLDVTITGGSVTDSGGGVRNNGGTLTIERSLLTSNTATSGGALATTGTTTLVNTTISGNSATNGAGIEHSAGTLLLSSVTVTDNTATSSGGGIRSTANAQLQNTIVAGNSATTSDPDTTGSFDSNGHNLIGIVGAATGLTNGTSDDQVGSSGTPLDPVLEDLKDNGGFTFTHRLLPGSPAIDAGDNALAPDVDQRSVSRPIGFDARTHTPTVDIGAHERNLIDIEGVKFFDANRNGVQDETEPGIAGWTIYLDLNESGQLDVDEPSTVTVDDDPATSGIDESGSYRLSDLQPGQYIVREELQQGWELTAPLEADLALAVVDLSTLDGTTGFRLDGIDTNDFSGQSVSSAGDVNGDGFDDLIIGAPTADPDSLVGKSYVVFGKSGGFASAIALSTLDGTNGFRLDGIHADDGFGFSVSSAGDVNGDGFDDLIIGAYRASPGGASKAGESYVVFGKSGGFASTIDLSTLDGATGFRLDGIDNKDYSGRSVSSAGDVNGDGFDDLIIGASGADPGGDIDAGESYVVFGKSGGFTAEIDLSTLNGTDGFRLDGIDAGDYAGRSVSSAGDVNGDGFDDLIIGALLAGPGGISGAGESYVVFGKSGGFASAIDLSTLDGTTGFRLDGIDKGDRSGCSVSSAGDVNGDGFDDLIIGADEADSEAGESYVVFGKSGGFASAIDLSTLDGTTGFRLDGIDAGDRSGRSVSSAGDVNGDGFDDLIIGAVDADPGGDSEAGESYVVFGKSGGFASAIDLSTLDGTTGFRLDGIDAGDRSGRSVSSAGDVNGDGFDDLIIGAPRADPDGVSWAGESYVVFGRELPIAFPDVGFWNVHALAGDAANSVDFGNAPLDGSISGRVFRDLNTNSIRDAGEAGLESWQVFLDEDNDNTLDMGETVVTTDSEGRYSFPGLTPLQTYRVVQVVQAGFEQTRPDPSGGPVIEVSLGAGEERADVDFGNLDTVGGVGLGSGKLEGFYFVDTNEDGDLDAGEERAGVTVFLDLNNNGVLDSSGGNPEPSQVTSATGFYRFEQLSGGTYTVRAINAEDRVQQFPRENSLSISDVDVGDFPQSIATGSFNTNTDSIPDLVVANVFTNDLSIMLREGDSFVAAANVFTGSFQPRSVAVADFNQDGTDDLVVGHESTIIVSILLGLGDGTFGSPMTLNMGGGQTTVSTGLFTDDAFPDIAVTSAVSNQAFVISNTTGTNFSVLHTVSTGSVPSRAEFSNLEAGNLFNANSDPDLVVSSFFSNQVETYFNSGTGSLSSAFTASVGLSPSDLAVADFDLDGKLDVATANQFSDNVTVLFNNGLNGQFDPTRTASYPAGSGPTAIEAVDMNVDGLVDLVVTNGSDSNLAVLFNLGGGVFQSPQNFGVGVFPVRLAWSVTSADFDQDGDPDLAVAKGVSNQVAILDNTLTEGAYRVILTGDGDETVSNLDFVIAPPPAPAPAAVTLPGGGNYEVLLDGSDLVVRLTGGAEQFREAAGTISVLTITGTAGDDIVTVLATGGVVSTPISFTGGSGNDRFDASLSTGPVTLHGGAGADTLSGGSLDDSITGGDDNDRVFAGLGNDLVDGGPGDDQIFGDAGRDTLTGSEGRDLLRGGQGADSLDGSDGFDTLFGDQANDTISGGNGDDTVFAGNGFDSVSGDAGNDRLFGNNGYDTMSGGVGNDFLRGGRGQDRLFGDAGLDELIGDDQNDTLNGGDDNDTLSGGNDADRVFAGAGNDQVDGGAGDDQLFGDAGGDTITGSTGRDILRGGLGADSLTGSDGFDTLYGDQGDDTISGGDGNDTVFGGNGFDSVFGDAGNDRLFGNNGYDTISGGAGNDFLRGARGRDSLTGDDGDDELIGDEHEDTLIGGSGSDRADGGAGADTIDVQEAPLTDGIDSVIGSEMADTVFVDPADLLI